MPDTLVKRSANVNDTIKLIVETVNKEIHSDFVKKLASELKPEGDKIAYMKRLFDFVCRNIKYKLDGEVDGVQTERVHKPSTTVRNRQGDCKKMTVLIASVLKVAGIEPLIKHVYYDGENFTHVYVIVPFPNLSNYITVDPVNDCKFNKEVSYASANIFDLNGNRMDLMTGAKNNSNSNPGFLDHVHLMACAVDHEMGCVTGTNADHTQATLTAIFEEDQGDIDATEGIGRKSKEQRQAKKKERKEKRQKVAQVVKKAAKKYGVAPMRGAFLELTKFNAMKLANHLAKAWAEDKKGIEGLWAGFGGKTDELKKAIIKGSGTNIAGIMPVQTGFAVATAIAASMPIIIAFLTKLKKMGMVKDGDTVDDLINDTLDSATDAVNDGSINEDDIGKSAAPDSGSPKIRNIKAVISEAPSTKVQVELQNPETTTDTNTDDGGDSTNKGSFVSPVGICLWGMSDLFMIQPSLTNKILFTISTIIALYFFLGIIPAMIYQSNHRWKKYVAFYFDLPIKFFSIIIHPFKKLSLKK